MTLPNLFIVGTQKSGTTSLHYYLNQHPEIFMSKLKEPRFFNFKYDNKKHGGPRDYEWDRSRITSIEDYDDLFKNVKSEKVVGEATIEYLYYLNVAQDIKNFNENAKILIVLRNPVYRALSAYTHLRRDLRELLDFEDALKEEENRIKANYHQIWHYKNVGLYYEQVKAYLDIFGSEQVEIILFDELKNDSSKVLKKLLAFLNVDPEFNFYSNKKLNASGIPKNYLLQKFLVEDNWIKSLLKLTIPFKVRSSFKQKVIRKNITRPEIDENTRNYLINYFRNDILKTQELIEKDLTGWLK